MMGARLVHSSGKCSSFFRMRGRIGKAAASSLHASSGSQRPISNHWSSIRPPRGTQISVLKSSSLPFVAFLLWKLSAYRSRPSCPRCRPNVRCLHLNYDYQLGGIPSNVSVTGSLYPRLEKLYCSYLDLPTFYPPIPIPHAPYIPSSWMRPRMTLMVEPIAEYH